MSDLLAPADRRDSLSADCIPSDDPVLLCAADVAPQALPWLWPGRIALGKLTLVAGDPGRGKSLLAIDVAARVTTGRPWPDAPHFATPQGGVVLLNAEDNPLDTLRPRLDAAAADVRRVNFLTAVRLPQEASGGFRALDLSRDLAVLDAAICRTPDCRLVIVDPLSAYLGRTNSHRETAVRALLAPLAEVAWRRGVAVLAITHLTKTVGKAIYRTMGSLAFAAAARSVWLVADDRDVPDRRLFVAAKNNLAGGSDALAYRVVDGPRIEWDPLPVPITADEALATLAAEPVGRGALAEAIDWLRETLALQSVPAFVVKTTAREDGIAPRTLDRAKSVLGVIASRDRYSGPWSWRLPEPAPDRQLAPSTSLDV